MGQPIKRPARRSKRWEVNAEATRAQIVESARRLFLREGYGRTTVEKIAAAAGVAPQTIYNAVGNKVAVLKAVFEAVASGPQAPRSVPELMRERARAATTPEQMIAILADWFVEVNVRMGGLWQVVAEAAAHDPEGAELARSAAHRRLRNYGMAADDLEQRGARGHGLDREGVAAAIWSIGHPQVYQTLVVESGWSQERYAAWVRTVLSAAVRPRGR